MARTGRPKRYEGETAVLSFRLPKSVIESFDRLVADLQARLPYGTVTRSDAFMNLLERAGQAPQSRLPPEATPAPLGAPVSTLEGLPGSKPSGPTPKHVVRERASTARATSSEAERVREMRRLGYSKAEIAQAFGRSGNWPDRYMRGLPIDCEAAARRMREAGMSLDEITKTLAHRMRGTDQQIDEGAVRRGFTQADTGKE